MILPLISTGLKIFQATRKKASSGSEMASNIVSKKTTVTGKSVGRPKSGAIVKASSNKISGAKFLQSTTDPSKDKIKAKDGILQGIASIINMINKFLSFILTTLIADNKLTQKQSENERRAGELALKRQRESSLEGDQDTAGVSSSKSKSKSGSFFDRIIKFISSIIFGSLVLAVYRRFTDIIQFFKDTYETIKGFFEKLDEYMTPLWNAFKFIVDFSSPLLRLRGNDDEKYAKDIEKEDDALIKELNKDLSDQNLDISEEELGAQLKAEADEDASVGLSLEEQIASGDIMPRAFTPIDPRELDRSFAKNMIKQHEGLRLTVYKDTKGFRTVGYGHKIDADSPVDIRNLKEGDTITQERANELFNMDFNDHLNAAMKIPGFNKATKKQQAALIDLTFNMGPNFIDNFPSMGKALKAGDFTEAARQLEFADPDNRPGVKSGYVKDVGPRRSDPIINLLQDKEVDKFPHLNFGDQSFILKDLSNKIDSIAMEVLEGEEEPMIVYVPIKTPVATGGGSGGNQMIVLGGEDVNSSMEKFYLAKQARVG